jgi:hypothetical protein
VTALPANLAAVGHDLARATHEDARRSAKRRRAATFALVFALLALTGGAAVATGLLPGETPAIRAMPMLADPTGEPRVLLTGLGDEGRTLTSMPGTEESICLTLSGYSPACFTGLLAQQRVSWWLVSGPDASAVIFGIVRDEVAAIEAVAGDGSTRAAVLANNAFYVENPGGSPAKLLVHLRDGQVTEELMRACPLSEPTCTP